MADAQELAADMQRLERVFGARLFSSRASSQASCRSPSPAASLSSFSGSLSAEFSSRIQISGAAVAQQQQQQVVWMLDADAPRCLSCDKRFIFPFRRRHHCRACGLIYCSRCCSRFVLHAGASAVLTCFACQLPANAAD